MSYKIGKRPTPLAVKVYQGDMEDRRSSPRYNTHMFVLESGGGYVKRFGNLSLGGCFFKTRGQMIVGQEVTVRFELDDLDAEFEARGKVIRLQPSEYYTGVAAQFDELSEESHKVLARWLELNTEKLNASPSSSVVPNPV